MAESPAHKFGQIIGELIESLLQTQLEDFCIRHALYLDFQKKERPAREGKKIAWSDQFGNTHDLDFVIEREGTDDQIGTPVAFIESAWRRYTKHSRNKAQEIQGAILPLAEKYKWNNPFLGVVLAGIFTKGSLDQLRSLGFTVLYLPYETIVAAFQSESINIAFDENTPDTDYTSMVKLIENIQPEIITRINLRLIEENQPAIDVFLESLEWRLGRHITRVIVIPLYGRINEFYGIEDALLFLERHMIYEGSGEFRRYEIRVNFSNGDTVEASLESKEKVKEFFDFIASQ